ncbi:MAG: hypothetical protein HOV87_29515 [Catenulispora sp.]|nr:hypothetical protein [Catenulispora sp.]
MSTANEQPGSGMPEEPVESIGPVEPGKSVEGEPADPHAEGGPDAGGAESAADGDITAEVATDITAESATEAAADGEETEEARVARERVEFDKLVAAFHGESAPDPQGRRPEPGAGVPGPGSPHKIIRYPVLDPRPEWEGSIVEPTDEITADPLDYVEHYEPPDPELPQASAATLASWTMLIGGVAFLVLHALLGWQTPEYLGWLAVIGVFGGIITLLARMKPDRDEYDDPDNGAVV